MANVLNRVTKEYLVSVNTPEYDPAVWIINPDVSAVAGQPTYYWVINADDSVSLMSMDDRANTDLWQPYMGLDLAGAIAYKSSLVNAYREQVQDGGWMYAGTHYDSDPIARQNMAGTMTLVHTGYVLPSNFVWRASNNVNVHFDNAGFTVFYQASCVWMEMNYQVSWFHKAQIAQLTTIADVAKYNFTVGWASGYTPPAPAQA